MASIDKIYMSVEQGKEFWLWILDHDEECMVLTGRSLTESFYRTETGYVTNYPEVIDWYLMEKCELDFIQARLAEQYVTERPQNQFAQVVDFLTTAFVSNKLPGCFFNDEPWLGVKDMIRFIGDNCEALEDAVGDAVNHWWQVYLEA